MTKNKKGILIFCGIVLLLILSLYFDDYIFQIISYFKSGFLDEFFMSLTLASSGIIILFFLTILLLWNKRKQKWILPLWFTLLISTIVSFVLKFVVQRPRPFQEGLIQLSSELIKDSYYIWNFSFPSNHALLAFCAIPILSKEFPKFRYVWIAIACLIAFSRIYFGFHFLSDVIAGAAIGYLIGALVVKSEKENHFWENIYERIYNMFVK